MIWLYKWHKTKNLPLIVGNMEYRIPLFFVFDVEFYHCLDKVVHNTSNILRKKENQTNSDFINVFSSLLKF